MNRVRTSPGDKPCRRAGERSFYWGWRRPDGLRLGLFESRGGCARGSPLASWIITQIWISLLQGIFFPELRREASARDVSVTAKLRFLLFSSFPPCEREGGASPEGPGHCGGKRRGCSPWGPMLCTSNPFFKAPSAVPSLRLIQNLIALPSCELCLWVPRSAAHAHGDHRAAGSMGGARGVPWVCSPRTEVGPRSAEAGRGHVTALPLEV